jgi:hypothetical protein
MRQPEAGISLIKPAAEAGQCKAAGQKSVPSGGKLA